MNLTINAVIEIGGTGKNTVKDMIAGRGGTGRNGKSGVRNTVIAVMNLITKTATITIGRVVKA